MIIGTGGKSTPGGVAVNAIRGWLRRHVICRHTHYVCITAVVTGVAAHCRDSVAGVINEIGGKIHGVMACAAFSRGNWMVRDLSFTNRINIIVASFASKWRNIED